MATQAEPEQIFEACDRFFSIPELVTIFLEQASVQVLLTCQQVCQSWNDEITNSQFLQEKLFFAPIESSEDNVEFTINPILLSHFSPILARSPSDLDIDDTAEETLSKLERGQSSNSIHLSLLPWFRTEADRSLNSPSRLAFSRPEASWRNMLVCQPPISRLDWWHEWIASANASAVDEETGDWEIASRTRDGSDVQRGWGHQDSNGLDVTIGMLWDLIEGRLARGCWARVMYFPHGKGVRGTQGEEREAEDSDVEFDEMASLSERQWAWDSRSQKRGWTAGMPRVKIQTRQIWDRVPEGPVGFDMGSRQWRSLTETERRDYAGDGFNALREDCSCEDQGAERWSKSEERFAWREIDGESSGGY